MFTPLGQGYRNPILISGVGQTQISSYQQYFSQYSAPRIGMFSPSTGAMDSIFLGGLSLYNVNFATGQLMENAELPFVDDVTAFVQQPNGAGQEYEMPSQLPGLFGAESRFFPAAGLPQYANGVLNLDQLLTQTTTLGYMYGGIVLTVGNTTNEAVQTMASNAIFKITLVPNTVAASNTTLVDSLYQVLLGRPADTAGQTAWVNELNAGTPASQVALGFIDSQEHRTRELNGFYNQFLGRSPDPSGLQFFLNEYANGGTDQKVIAQILNSTEFSNDNAGNSAW